MANNYANQLLLQAASNDDAELANLALARGATNLTSAIAVAQNVNAYDVLNVLGASTAPSYPPARYGWPPQKPQQPPQKPSQSMSPWQMALQELSQAYPNLNLSQLSTALRPIWQDVVSGQGLTWQDAVDAAHDLFAAR